MRLEARGLRVTHKRKVVEPEIILSDDVRPALGATGRLLRAVVALRVGINRYAMTKAVILGVGVSGPVHTLFLAITMVWKCDGLP